MAKTLLVGVPVYGQVAYTHALVGDLRREGVDFVIIDNKGDYEPLGDEWVITPGENLGWAGGSNFAFRTAFAEGYANAMTLNNDVRLSHGFFDALLDERLPAEAGLISPVYDDAGGHRAMLSDHYGDASSYAPREFYRELPSVDGTGMVITREAWLQIGGLDARTFGTFGWGANLDLCVRARAAGFVVLVTEGAFLNHFRGTTARSVSGRFRYALSGMRNLRRGMKRVHGRGWRTLIEETAITRRRLSDHSIVPADIAA